MSIYGEALELYRKKVGKFFAGYGDERLPILETTGIDRDFWRAAGSAGVLGSVIPKEYGGPGADPVAAVVLSEETGRWIGGATIGATLSGDLGTGFLLNHGTEEQKRSWFPGILKGEVIQAMALTESHAGSDAAAISASAQRDDDHYVLNGCKSLVMNGMLADLFYMVVKTNPAKKGRGMSMIIVPGSAEGLSRRRVVTMGFKGGDTAEVTMTDVRVPAANLLGREGEALAMFQHAMALDRMQIAARSLGTATAAFETTLAYCRERRMFGQRLIDFQNTQFTLAQIETELAVSRHFLDALVMKFREGTFNDDDGAMVKIWLPEMEGRVLDACIQLWGGSGFVDDNPISRMYTGARPQRVYAGATELMKSLIGRKYLL
ncbi:MAG: acyl-CoA dehydrogenase family protein [Porticoccaceae bacterium]